MRPLLSLILTVASAFAASQTATGTYRPTTGASATWTINENHTLMWDGAAYLPIGVRASSAAEVEASIKAGIRDFVLEVPTGGNLMTELTGLVDKAGGRYLIAIDSLAAPVRGYAVEPESYRVQNVKPNQVVDLPLPGAPYALAVLITRRDMMIQSSEKVKIENGRFIWKAGDLNSLEHQLVIYPRTESLSLPDYWESFDQSRDKLLNALTATPHGSGLRGIANPMGEMLRLPTGTNRFIPDSAYFRAELREFLRNRYRTVDTAVKAWSIAASDISSWDALARLVPLWSGTRGIPRLWDPVRDHLYTADSRRSSVWSDVETVISSTANRRFARLVPAIRRITNVPVVQEWAGWASPYEGGLSPIDGIAMRARGASITQLSDAACRATSSILRWSRPGLLIATDIGVSSAKLRLSETVEDLVSLGARGIFFRVSEPELLTAIAEEAQRGQSNSNAATWSPIPLFYPENAANPAMPQRLPGGRWWLPSPAAGNRVDLGRQFNAYRYKDDANEYFVLWSTETTARVKLRALEPKKLIFTTIDGSDPKPRVSKNGVEISLSPTPIVITGTSDIPIPEPALTELLGEFDAASKLSEATRKDITEEAYLFRDSSQGFERNPGGAYLAMRTQFNRIARRLAEYEWIEAESSRNHSFGETLQTPGCSNSSALSNESPFAGLLGGLQASYVIPVRTTEDQEVWIAARLSPDQRTGILVTVSGQSLRIESEPQSPYGNGFAWYRCGITKLAGTQAILEVRLTADASYAALDAIVLFPGKFAPRGVFLPGLQPTNPPSTTFGLN